MCSRFNAVARLLSSLSLLHPGRTFALVKTGVYIDGLNFYYGALKGTADKWLNIEKFIGILLPRDEIQVIRYFTARVNARVGDPGTPTRQDTYLRALRTSANVQIHTGHFRSNVKWKALADKNKKHTVLFMPHFRPVSIYSLMWKDKVRRRTDGVTKAQVIIDEEKGSDVNLGVHLLHDCAQGKIEKAVVLSNDSDLTEALVLARFYNVEIWIMNPHKTATSKALENATAFKLPFRRTALSQCQFPNIMKDNRGREFHKPSDW